MAKIKVNSIVFLALFVVIILLIITNYTGYFEKFNALTTQEGVLEKTLKAAEDYALNPISEEDKKELTSIALKTVERELRKRDKYLEIEIEQEKGNSAKPTPITMQDFSQNERRIYYIKIANFTQKINQLLEQIINPLINQKSIPAGIEQFLIIDLRDNPGGMTLYTAQVLDLFLPKGERLQFPLETNSEFEDQTLNFKTKRAQIIKKEIKLFVLVNEQTASAAEMFADNIQRYNRGIVIGTKTFGKNLAQNWIEIRKGINLKLTTVELEYKSGGNKIIPDIEIEENQDALEVALHYILKK